MAQPPRKNGTLEIRYDADRTRAMITITPPQGGGKPVEVGDVLQRLKWQFVYYGIHPQAILEAIHQVKETGEPVRDVLVAQGILPEDGTDAYVHYHLPLETLALPLPKDAKGQPDWFALKAGNMVRAEQEIATITPSFGGVPGSTLTCPVRTVAPRPGKPAAFTAGDNVRIVGGIRVLANVTGYACLHHETLTVYALQRIETPTTGGIHTFAHGAVYLDTLTEADIRADGFIAIRGAASHCYLHSHGDITVRAAYDCTLIASGCVYVQEEMRNCRVITPEKIIASPQSKIVGGSLCAREGVTAGSLGAVDFTLTEVIVGEDRYSAARNGEIEEELQVCEANKERISQALKPFMSITVHTHLTEDKYALLQKMQAQKIAFEEHSLALYAEHRALMLSCKSHTPGRIEVVQTIYPGVRLHIGGAHLQMQTPQQRVEFVPSANGRLVQVRPLAKAA